MKHELDGLVDRTLIREGEGITARCTCGWVSGGHFSSLAASAAMQDHIEEQEGARPAFYEKKQL